MPAANMALCVMHRQRSSECNAMSDSKCILKCIAVVDIAILCCAERGDRDHDSESYSVRLCTNTECARTLWNRDLNAAINILRLFLAWVNSEDKPAQFCRAVH